MVVVDRTRQDEHEHSDTGGRRRASDWLMSPRGRAMGGVAIVVVIALGAAGVVVLTRGGSSKAPRPATPASKSAPAPVSQQTASSAVPPLPTLARVGRDWPAVVAGLDNYLAWLFEHPDPSLVGNYATPDCPCFSAIQTTLADYQATGQRRLTNGDKVDQVRLTAVIVPSQGRSDSAVDLSVYVTQEGVANALLDRHGQVLQRSSASGPVGYDVELLLGPDGQWRIRHVLCLGTPGVGRGQGCPQ
jgi:hypothetical protein